MATNVQSINNAHEAGWHGYRVAYSETVAITENNNLSNDEKIKQLTKAKNDIDKNIINYNNYELLSNSEYKNAWLNNYKQYIDDTITKLKYSGKYYIRILADYSDGSGDVDHKSMIPIISNRKITVSDNFNDIQFYDDKQSAIVAIKNITDKEILNSIKKYIPGSDYEELINYNIIVEQHQGLDEYGI